jgi:hypothetical protein
MHITIPWQSLGWDWYELGAGNHPSPIAYLHASSANNVRAYTAGLMARLFGVDLSMCL